MENLHKFDTTLNVGPLDIHVTRSWDRIKERAQYPRVFVHLNGETLWENLENRRNRPVTAYRNLTTFTLDELGFTDYKLQWSQNAGCFCPCSPGFIVKGLWSGGDIHITVGLREGASLPDGFDIGELVAVI